MLPGSAHQTIPLCQKLVFGLKFLKLFQLVTDLLNLFSLGEWRSQSRRLSSWIVHSFSGSIKLTHFFCLRILVTFSLILINGLAVTLETSLDIWSFLHAGGSILQIDIVIENLSLTVKIQETGGWLDTLRVYQVAWQVCMQRPVAHNALIQVS